MVSIVINKKTLFKKLTDSYDHTLITSSDPWHGLIKSSFCMYNFNMVNKKEKIDKFTPNTLHQSEYKKIVIMKF